MANAPVPPQHLEAEESVLGAMMLSPGVLPAVSEILSPGDFYRESHARIYRAALALDQEGTPIDAITVTERLAQTGELDGLGGRQRIHELAALVPATANATHYARIVQETATLRGLIRVGQEVTRLGWERPGETTDLLDQAEQVLFDLSRDRERGEVPLIGAGARAAYDRLVALYESGQEIIGVPTGLLTLDRMTSGFQPGSLVVLAARPSMGKSALALSVAGHVSMNVGLPVALFTLEMNTAEVTHRLLSLEAGVDLHKLRTGRLNKDDWARVMNATARIEKARLFVDDDSAATMLEIRSRARRLKRRNPDLALVIVDYLQLMTADAENRVQEVSRISRSMKVLAGDLDVPVLALSQLSRAPEQRHDKRPLLSDLRESGSIEQDADIVMFVYRDEYYNPEDPEVQGLAEVIIAKHRNGPTGVARLTFVKSRARFSDPPLPGTGGPA